MSARKGRKGKLPRYVQRHKKGYRGWFMEAGVRRYTPTVSTPEEAHEEAVARRRALDHPRGRLTLGQGIELVKENLRARGRRPGTLAWYQDQFAALQIAWYDYMHLDELTSADVERFIRGRQKEVSPNTVRQHLRALNRIFELAIQKDLLDRNPVKGATKPEPVEPQVQVLAWDRAQQVLSQIAGPDGDLVTLLLYTGIRRAEVARIKVDDLGNGQLPIVGKRGNRVLPVPEDLKLVLGRLIARSTGLWLVNGETEEHRCAHVTRVFRRWRQRLEEPGLQPHSMRRTFASELAKRGVPEHVLADLLGHSRRRSITQVYITTFGPEVTKAMGMLWTGGHWDQ